MNKLLQVFFYLCLFWVSNAQAILEIEITKGVDGALPIAVVPLAGATYGFTFPDEISKIITADLARSGRFDMLDEADMIEKPTKLEEVVYDDWKRQKVEHIVMGQVRQRSDGWLSVRIYLMDVFREKQLFGKEFRVSSLDVRGVAHHISDLIYEQLTGVKGAFSTQIAYVTSTRDTKDITYKLVVADSDGFYPKTVLESKEPIMSPAWSADAKQLAYVSFEKKRSEIYVQQVSTGKRRKISSSKGINGAPSWSPNGEEIAVTLSSSGNPEIYIIHLASNKKRRLTDNWSIDTEPVWSPDGKEIVFTSDRGGKPQLYKVSARGGAAKRITFEGDYNARASFSPNGKEVVMVHGNGGIYRIAILELESGIIRVLSQGRLDESPTFAPNGGMILYATDVKNQGVLAAVSDDGRVQQRLVSQEGHVREPAWSPYTR